jgi:hypothetical protein
MPCSGSRLNILKADSCLSEARPVSSGRGGNTEAPAVELLLRELVAGQRALDAKVDVLLARLAPGPRDGGDVALGGIIATVSRGLPITAAALWRRRIAGDLALAEALATCDIENPKQLGKLLRRLEGRDMSGVRLCRVGENREGIVWQARVQESSGSG